MTQADWEKVRVQAAIAAMQSYCSIQMGFTDYPDSQVAGLAVKQADALIKELQKENYMTILYN